MSEELDDLRALLHHPGFLLLCQHQARLTGDAMPQIRLALEGDDDRALRELRRLVAERDAGKRILRWPAQRVKDLEARAGSIQPTRPWQPIKG